MLNPAEEASGCCGNASWTAALAVGSVLALLEVLLLSWLLPFAT